MEEISIWERDNDREFLMEGVCFKEFVKRQWEEYTANKEAEKVNRVKHYWFIYVSGYTHSMSCYLYYTVTTHYSTTVK